MVAQAVEPVARDLSVAVEQQHVVGVGMAHAAVDGADEAQVVLVLQQRDARLGGGFFAQPLGDLGLGAGVVDDDQAQRHGLRAGQHGFEAQLGVGQAAVDGHDDVDHAAARRRRGRRRGFGVGAVVGAGVGSGAAPAEEQAVQLDERAGVAEHA